MKYVILDTAAGQEISISLTWMEADDLIMDLDFIRDQGADLEPFSQVLFEVLNSFTMYKYEGDSAQS